MWDGVIKKQRDSYYKSGKEKQRNSSSKKHIKSFFFLYHDNSNDTTSNRLSIFSLVPSLVMGLQSVSTGGQTKEVSLKLSRSCLSLSLSLYLSQPPYLYLSLSQFLSQIPSIDLLSFSHPSPPFLSFLALITHHGLEKYVLTCLCCQEFITFHHTPL